MSCNSYRWNVRQLAEYSCACAFAFVFSTISKLTLLISMRTGVWDLTRTFYRDMCRYKPSTIFTVRCYLFRSSAWWQGQSTLLKEWLLIFANWLYCASTHSFGWDQFKAHSYTSANPMYSKVFFVANYLDLSQRRKCLEIQFYLIQNY